MPEYRTITRAGICRAVRSKTGLICWEFGQCLPKISETGTYVKMHCLTVKPGDVVSWLGIDERYYAKIDSDLEEVTIYAAELEELVA